MTYGTYTGVILIIIILTGATAWIAYEMNKARSAEREANLAKVRAEDEEKKAQLVKVAHDLKLVKYVIVGPHDEPYKSNAEFITKELGLKFVREWDQVEIHVAEELPNEEIHRVTGLNYSYFKIRGFWYFEGDFPLILTDWDGKIIAEGHATAKGEWMTDSFVPFSGTLEFEKSETSDSIPSTGSLILKKDNPSDLPENDDALEMTVRFE